MPHWLKQLWTANQTHMQTIWLLSRDKYSKKKKKDPRFSLPPALDHLQHANLTTTSDRRGLRPRLPVYTSVSMVLVVRTLWFCSMECTQHVAHLAAVKYASDRVRIRVNVWKYFWHWSRICTSFPLGGKRRRRRAIMVDIVSRYDTVLRLRLVLPCVAHCNQQG